MGVYKSNYTHTHTLTKTNYTYNRVYMYTYGFMNKDLNIFLRLNNDNNMFDNTRA